MHVTVDRAAAKDALSMARRARGSWALVRVRTVRDRLELDCWDATSTTTVSIAATVHRRGKASVSARELAALLPKGTGDLDLELGDQDRLRVRTTGADGEHEEHLPTMLHDGHSRPMKRAKGDQVTWTPQQLARAGAVATAATDDASLPVITGVLVNGHLAATDRYRLLVADVIGPTPDRDLVVPATAVRKVASWRRCEVTVLAGDDRVSFVATVPKGPRSAPRELRACLTTRLVPGTFPDVSSLWPADTGTTVQVERKRLHRAVADLAASAGVRSFVLARDARGRLAAQAPGSAGEPTPVTDAPAPATFPDVLLDPRLTKSLLAALEGDTVTVGVRDGLKPVVFDDGQPLRALQMPLRRNT